MINWENKYYDKTKKYVVVLFICDLCKEEKFIRKQNALKKKYSYCYDCYQKSPECSIKAKKMINNRPNYDGKNNPNHKGKIEKQCKCGKTFYVVQSRKDTAKYCSYGCASTYRPHSIKQCQYKEIFFRSSWEMKFAQYLDNLSIEWKYEPETFKTSFGNYTPDFWIPSWNSFVEVKGYFRKDAEKKFNECSRYTTIILADKDYLKNLGVL